MSFVIISDHDRRGDLLSDQTILVVLNGKYHLKSKFLVLVSAVACNAHRSVYLQGALGNKGFYPIPGRVREDLA